MTRTLSLRRETLTELSANELSHVAGGRPDILTVDDCPLLSGMLPTLPVRYCLQPHPTNRGTT